MGASGQKGRGFRGKEFLPASSFSFLAAKHWWPKSSPVPSGYTPAAAYLLVVEL